MTKKQLDSIIDKAIKEYIFLGENNDLLLEDVLCILSNVTKDLIRYKSVNKREDLLNFINSVSMTKI